MKIKLFVLFFVLGCCLAPVAKAAFVIHKQSVEVSDSSATSAESYTAPLYQDGWAHHGGLRREAHRAWFWARWGVFIWPLGILAIIHGFRALRRRDSDNDLAILAIIFGFAELLLCIAAIWWFFFWGPWVFFVY